MKLTKIEKRKKKSGFKTGFSKIMFKTNIEDPKIETLNFWFTLTSPFSHIRIKQPAKQNSTNIRANVVIYLSCKK